jgi:O-acetyl-ADP-ribose deacetylase (regulator of RNase III)
MMIYTRDSLFDSPAQTLVNAVNTVCVMGKGVALEFKRRYPAMFREYQAICKRGELAIGRLWLYKAPDKWVLNFPTKIHWRDPSNLEYIEAGLRTFVDTYKVDGITSISFPMLGTGAGGLNWENAVRPLMESYLSSLPIPIYIHLYATAPA